MKRPLEIIHIPHFKNDVHLSEFLNGNTSKANGCLKYPDNCNQCVVSGWVLKKTFLDILLIIVHGFE